MPVAISPSQHTISNCAFAAQRHDEDSENFMTSHENTTVTSNVTSTILLKTAKTVASSANKKLMARIFFGTAFANELNLAPTTHEFITVHGFGGKVIVTV